MLAFMNLQTLSASPSLDGAPDRGVSSLDTDGDAGVSSMPFADLLRVRRELPAEIAGEFLPANGNTLPPTGAEELSTASIAGSVPDASSEAQDLLRRADSFAPDLRADLHMNALTNKRPQVDVELDLTVTYPVTEPLGDVTDGVSLLPVTPQSLRQAPPADVATPLNRLVEQPMQAVARPSNDMPLVAAVATESEQTLATTTEAGIAASLTEGPLRDKILAPAAPVGRPAVTALDTSLSADDVGYEEMPLLPGRTSAALETVLQPDTRAAAVSTAHQAIAVNLPGNASSFTIEAGPGRTDTMLDTISTPVRDNAWGDKLGERVLLMTNRQLQSAELRLTPADLGPVRVRVSVEEGAAHVTFHAQHAVTREAIEQALPRLREMLTESGLSLGQTDVSEHGVADGRDDRAFNPDADGAVADEAADAPHEPDMTERRKIVSSNNLLDTFA